MMKVTEFPPVTYSSSFVSYLIQAANENDLCDQTTTSNKKSISPVANCKSTHNHHQNHNSTANHCSTAISNNSTKISPVVKMRWKQLARNAFNHSIDQQKVKQDQQQQNGLSNISNSNKKSQQSNTNGFLRKGNLLENLLSLTSHHNHTTSNHAEQPDHHLLSCERVDSSSWVQLSGHEDSFALAGPGTIWKKRAADSTEVQVYESLMRNGEAIQEMLPKYYRDVLYKGDHFIELEDLLYRYHGGNDASMSIMDIKMGSRTFLEAEVAKNSKPRTDLYEKMIKIDPLEPTAEEHAARAITKLRYMQFREDLSSSSNLGFRIEGFKVGSDVKHNKNLHLIKERDEVASTLATFFQRKPEACQAVISRLRQLRKCFENSSFFAEHEVIGSSLLIIYTAEKVGVFMIDFAKTLKLPESVHIDHRSSWSLGNHEDGYLFGLDNLISVLEEVSRPCP